MSKKRLRVLVTAANRSDCRAMEATIARGGIRAEVSAVLLNEVAEQLAHSRFEAVVLDYATEAAAAENILRTVPAGHLMVLVDPKYKEFALRAVRQGAEVLIKDAAGLYTELLPLKLKTLLEAESLAKSQTIALPGEYEQLAHSLFEHSPNMIFINSAGRIVYANEKCVEVMGYPREEFYSRDFNFLCLIAPESLEVIKLNFGRHLREEDVPPYDYTLLTKSGRRVEAIMSSKLIQYRGRQAILGIVTDISHRKRIEEELTRARNELEHRIEERTLELVKTNESLLTEIRDRQRVEGALRESEERYRIISSLTSDYVYSMSCQEGYALEWVSGAFEKITGYTIREIAGFDHWLHVIHPDDAEVIRTSTEKLFSGGSCAMEYRIRTKDGRVRWLYDQVHPVRDEQTGRTTAIVGAVRDVTEHKQALEALKESELKFKTLFENAGGAIFVADAKTGCIVECNTEAERLTGLPRETLIGMHQTRLHAPAEAEFYRERFRQNVAAGGLIDFECEVEHASGRKIPVWISTQVMSLTDRRVIMGLFLDISAKRRADQQRAELAEMLEEKNRELESIIHVASHDLRTPLITITGFAGELRRSCLQLQDLLASGDGESLDMKAHAILGQDIPEAVGLIAASAAKLNALLDGLMRLARFEPAGDEMAAIDMNAMLAEIIKTLTYQARNRNVEFRVDPLPGAWGDEQQINQVFSNLLDNALKYLEPSRPGLIVVSGKQNDDHAVYCVEDNGIGIDTNNLPHIFKMYYRANPKQTDGQGLGLAIVRRILSRHNGKVWAESREGRGSRFFVSLPNVPA